MNLDQQRVIFRFIIVSVCRDQKYSRVINEQVSLSIFSKYVNKSSLLPDANTVLNWLKSEYVIEDVTPQYIQLNMDRFKFLCNRVKIKYGEMSRYITACRKFENKDKIDKINKGLNAVENMVEREKRKQDVANKVDELFDNLLKTAENLDIESRFKG